MSNRGGVTSEVAELLAADHQIVFLAVKAEFDTETLHLWSGDTDLVIDGATYTGVGTLLNLSEIEESGKRL